MAHSIVISASFVCHVDPPCRPLEQLYSEMFFELLDLLTERRIGDLQGFRRSPKAAYFHDPNEGPDCLHVVDDAPPYGRPIMHNGGRSFHVSLFMGAIGGNRINR